MRDTQARRELVAQIAGRLAASLLTTRELAEAAMGDRGGAIATAAGQLANEVVTASGYDEDEDDEEEEEET